MYLKKRSALYAVLTIVLLNAIICSPGQARTLRPDEGQAKLMQEVNAGQKSKQLTLKEANKLRKALANVARKKKKMLGKSGKKLTAADTEELKSDINKISENMQKLELEKRK